MKPSHLIRKAFLIQNETMKFYPYEEDNPDLLEDMLSDIRQQLKKYQGARIELQITAKISNHSEIDNCSECLQDQQGVRYGKLFL